MQTPTDLRPHPDRPDIYVTPDGRILRELPSSPSWGGYRTIKVGKETIRRHTLVAQTFHGERPFPKAEVRHLNGDPGDDSPGNLRWGTRIENMGDAIEHGRTTRGERNARSKLTTVEAREVLDRRRAGESGRSLADEFGVSEQTVCDIYKRRLWPELD